MSICNFKKVRESQPHWQTPHKRNLYNHPMRWEPTLDTNAVKIRAKWHKPQDTGQLSCSRVCMKSREIRGTIRTGVGPVVNYKAVRRATLRGRSAYGGPRPMGCGELGGGAGGGGGGAGSLG